MEKTLNILFFSAWYPHRYDAMAGLFVRKHAEAVAHYAHVCVLFPYADAKTDHFEILEQTTNNVIEIYVYFPYHGRLSQRFNYFRAYIKGIKYIFQRYGKPDITHANVFIKPTLVGYLLKKIYYIPYVVTEHWSGYLSANGSFVKSGKTHRFLTRFLAKRAACVMPVSGQLQKSMQACGIEANYQLVPNVVDDFFYHQQPPLSRLKKRILHISCFDENSKNIKGILRTIKALSEVRHDFELVIVGTGIDFETVYSYAQIFNFPKGLVQFVGEQTPQQVCEWFCQSDFFLLFSNYETAGVVLQESWTCGKPVLSTPVGMMLDVETDKLGKSTPIGDEKALEQNINWMLDHFQEFDSQKIREIGSKYSYNEVGAKLREIYESTLNKRNR